ncbi:MAG: GNAT family N-acetyltransferase [Silanimonas sp.]|jgi:ribosomal protein S18 acetylase RimI-like enzyme|nr:GNAT family N-acetyltransferase [Silanimonas sp.]
MIVRQFHRDDQLGVISLAERSGLFSSEELAHLEQVVSKAADQDDAVWLVTGDGQIDGAVYAACEPMSDRVWNVLMLIVDPVCQGGGVGKALMSAIEDRLTGTARLLLVETSEGEGLDVARAFYPRCGYREVARIPSYYGNGIGKIVFQKMIHETTGTKADHDP